MTAICLIRHGETDWNAKDKIQGTTDIPLNDNGLRQARECSDHLKADDWDVIITSPLIRAKQTAKIINQKLQLPLYEMEEFQERHFGDAEGLSIEDRKAIFPDKNYPNQEQLEPFINRIMKGLKKVNKNYPYSRVLLVAHGAVINSIIIQLSEEKNLPEKIPLVNACMSNIQFQENKWKVRNFNQVTHLSEHRIKIMP